MKIAAPSRRWEYGVDMVKRSLDQVRTLSGSLHSAAQHLPMNLSLIVNELLAKLNRLELELEDLERSVVHQTRTKE